MINVILILRNGGCGLELLFARCCASVGRPCSSKLRSSVQKKKKKETTDPARFVGELKGAVR